MVPEAGQEVPERQRVLPAGDRDQDALARLEHPVRVDRPPHLLLAVVQEVVAAERGVVAADVDHRRSLAHAALHRRALTVLVLTGCRRR